ncbi:Sec-independent protein translocase protein TatB [Roseicyclus sp. F158]|uniref:Sec-independent protein translocase protein TatB n=1 Tax=Tropicimonas omnivorans TaxID=3075590 RepID=A0ABU3DG77_9RHOB|nr:Sec-independent protein translocase protein TatB [Roseicyclus sp. F158]MDT0682717.1 Sec-independent protein translocase protein TatB [Roseicyclus sp. F158]
MLDIGWSELLVIGVVALIVVGPKDLPVLFRTLGQFTGKMKRMAREFTSAMEDAADQSGMKDVQRDLRSMTNPKKMGVDALKKATKFDPFGEHDAETGKTGAGSKAAARSAAGSDGEDRAVKAAQMREAAATEAQDRIDAEAASDLPEADEERALPEGSSFAAPSSIEPAPADAPQTPEKADGTRG